MSVLKRLLIVPVVLVGAGLLLLAALAVAPPRWLGAQAAALASAALGVPVEIERLSVSPFSLAPALDVTALGVAVPDAPDSAVSDVPPAVSDVSLQVSLDLLAALRGQLLIEQVALSEGSVFVQRYADGSTSIDALLAGIAGESEADAPANERAPAAAALPAIRRVSIDGLQLSLQDEGTASALELQLRASGSTIDADQPVALELSGTLSRDGTSVPASLSGTIASTSPPADGLGDLRVTLDAALGALVATLDARIADPAGRARVDADITVQGDSLDAVQTLSAVTLPKVPSYRLQGTLRREGSELRLARFDATLGDSVFEGDVRVDLATQPTTLYANIIFTALDLDELLAITVGEGVETADVDERVDDVISGGRGWFPDRSLGLPRLARLFDGQVDARAAGIDSRWPVETLDVGLTLQARRLRLDPLEASIAGGKVAGKVEIDTAGESPDGTLELDVERIELVRIAQALGVDDDSVGVLGGRMRYWFNGDSIAEIAGSVDGGTFLLMSGGRLDALLTELVGLDVVESLTLLVDPDKTLTPIDCAYVDLLAESGVLDIERFIVDTQDTVIIADGTVDLGANSFELAIEPHAKDASLFSAQGPVAITGSNGDVSIRPGPDVAGRAALAALLASVAAPAAALLPLIRSGGGEDSVYCDGLIDKLDEAR